MDRSSGSNIPSGSESPSQTEITMVTYMDRQLFKAVPSVSESPNQTEITTLTYMDRQLFKAAAHGDMEPLNPYQDHLDRLVDANQNTALHIYCSNGGYKVVKKDCRFLWFHLRKSKSVLSINYLYLQQLLDKCPSLLGQANARGEIPLHLAAKHGHHDIVSFLIQRSKEQLGGDLEHMLRTSDEEQNTALHKAAQYGDHLHVVRALLKEDPDLSSSVNKSGETPLYIAAIADKSSYDILVAEILDTNCIGLQFI